MMDTTQSVESELILSGSTRGFLRLQAAYFLRPRSLNLVGVTSEVLLKYYVISFLPVTATYLALYPNNPAAYIYIPKFVHALSPLLSISTIPIAALLQLIILVVGLSPILVLTRSFGWIKSLMIHASTTGLWVTILLLIVYKVVMLFYKSSLYVALVIALVLLLVFALARASTLNRALGLHRRRWSKVAVGASLVSMLATSRTIAVFVVSVFNVVGTGMMPTIQPGETVLSSRLQYLIDTPRRGDICLLQDSEGLIYVGRVVGMPNEKIFVENGNVKVNDIALLHFELGVWKEKDNTQHEQYAEVNPDGIEYRVLIGDRARKIRALVQTRQSEYVLMVDNRDNMSGVYVTDVSSFVSRFTIKIEPPSEDLYRRELF